MLMSVYDGFGGMLGCRAAGCRFLEEIGRCCDNEATARKRLVENGERGVRDEIAETKKCHGSCGFGVGFLQMTCVIVLSLAVYVFCLFIWGFPVSLSVCLPFHLSVCCNLNRSRD